MKDGLILLGAASPRIHLADPAANAEEAIRLIREAAEKQIAVLTLPELFLTGTTCGDLLRQAALIGAAQDALVRVAAATAGVPMLVFVGVPLVWGGRLYSCAAAVSGGMILGVVPKSVVRDPDGRWFSPAPEKGGRIHIGAYDVPFGTDLLFACREMPSLVVGCELGGDFWAPVPVSARLCAAGATVIAGLGASPETVTMEETRRAALTAHTKRLYCAYMYAECGAGESTTDLVFSGNCLIADGGVLAAENPPFGGRELTCAEADLDHLTYDRMRTEAYPAADPEAYRTIAFSLPVRETPIMRPVNPRPFIPADEAARGARCRRILEIQCRGLARRIEAAHAPGAVVAISGGLDSCLALLVTARTFALLGRDPGAIKTVTLPGFGTTKRTKSNAQTLCEELHTDFREISIAEAVSVHFRDIGHDPDDHSVTYENAQARERTQVIMDIANEDGSLVIGTGDLSELALGWATFNGDHMSNYGVNAGVPKTLIRHLVAYCADEAEADGHSALAAVLRDILDTPVSPELLPAKDGEIAQRTEDIVGPYDLHDFFLYHMLRWGENPAKIYRLARAAFAGQFDDETIRRWLRTFTRRFFIQQFKRSCLPDGPAVGSVGVSPRGGWSMPSDAEAALWLAECGALDGEA